MKNLIATALILLPLFALAEPSKECVNVGEIADVSSKAFLSDGTMFAVRVADIQVTTPLHPVKNLVAFEIEDGVVKINFASVDRFAAARKECARLNIVDAYANAACKLGSIADRLKPFRINSDTASKAMEDSRSSREGVDGVQASTELISKQMGVLNKQVGLSLIKIWNEVSGNNLSMSKKKYIAEDINPLKDSLSKMVVQWTGKPPVCGK